MVWEMVRRREDSIRKGVPWIGINGICCFGCQHLDVVHWELRGCFSWRPLSLPEQISNQPHRLEADPQRIRATRTGLQPRSNRHAPAQPQSASNRLDQLAGRKTPSVLDHRLIPLASCAYIFVGNWFGLIKWLEWPLGTGCPDLFDPECPKLILGVS